MTYHPLVIHSILWAALFFTPLGVFAQDEREIEAAQEERQSQRWAPEQNLRTLQRARQQNQLELYRRAQATAEAFRNDQDAAREAVNQQKARVLNDQIRLRAKQQDASEKRQLNQAKVEEAREIQDAVGFSGTQLIDLGLQQNSSKNAAARRAFENRAKQREIGFLKEQEGFLLNEQRRLEVMGEPDGAESLEGEVGAVRSRLDNLRKPPSDFFPGMPLGNPVPDQNFKP